MRRMPELMSDAEAADVLAADQQRPKRHRTLASGTFYLAADVRDVARGKSPGRRRMPELMGAKEAAEHLGVKGPNLYKLSGVSGVPQQKTARGTVYLAPAVRALKELRDEPQEAGPRTCAQHGDDDMRTSSKTGARWCAVCGRERKRALLRDSVRREAYNSRRRERYREQQQQAEVAS
jgi:hypothetical protein